MFPHGYPRMAAVIFLPKHFAFLCHRHALYRLAVFPANWAPANWAPANWAPSKLAPGKLGPCIIYICIGYSLPTIGVYMWHSQILGSFAAKNITCVFLHENSFLAIKITKDIFPDDKKYKKVPKSSPKNGFAFSSPMAEKILVSFHPLCVLYGWYFNNVGKSKCDQIYELA